MKARINTYEQGSEATPNNVPSTPFAGAATIANWIIVGAVTCGDVHRMVEKQQQLPRHDRRCGGNGKGLDCTGTRWSWYEVEGLKRTWILFGYSMQNIVRHTLRHTGERNAKTERLHSMYNTRRF